MYLFTRQLHLAGPLRDLMGWATGMGEYVNEIGSVPVSVWTSSMGNPIGSFAFSAVVESHAQLGALTDQLMADEGYLDRVDAGSAFMQSPGEDSLLEFITDPGEAGPPQIALITTAVIANGRQADAMQWGVDMAGLASTITGQTTSFLTQTYGTFGEVSWIQGHDDMAGVDAANDALSADEGYLEGLIKSADLFLPGSGRTALATRLI